MKEIVNRLHENRQIELAKSILESNGYKVTKKSRGLKESDPSTKKLSDIISNEGEEYVYLSDLRKFVEESDEYNNSEYDDIKEERENTLAAIKIVEKWFGVSADKIYIVSENRESPASEAAYEYLGRAASDPSSEVVKEVRVGGPYSPHLVLFKTSEGYEFVSMGDNGYMEYYYL